MGYVEKFMRLLNDFSPKLYKPQKSCNFYLIVIKFVCIVQQLYILVKIICLYILFILLKFQLCGSHRSQMTFFRNFVSSLKVIISIGLSPNLEYIYRDIVKVKILNKYEP